MIIAPTAEEKVSSRLQAFGAALLVEMYSRSVVALIIGVPVKIQRRLRVFKVISSSVRALRRPIATHSALSVAQAFDIFAFGFLIT